MAARRGLIGVTVAGALVASGGLALPSMAHAATATRTGTVSTFAVDDTYTSSTRRTVNFGRDDTLVVGKSGGQSRMSYVKFTTGALPAGAKVTAAELRLPLIGRPIVATLSVFPVSAGWTETKLTTANAPALPAASISITPASTATMLRIDVSKLIGKAGTYAFALKQATGSGVTRFHSVEYGDDHGGGPQLQVAYAVTTPATAPAAASTTLPTTRPPAKPTTAAPTTAVPTTAPPTTAVPTTAVPTTAVPTTAPTTTPPVVVPGTTAPSGVPSAPACVTDALLVPSCGVLWGAAAGGFTDTPRDQALLAWEGLTGRTATIFHAYHRGDEQFPTKAEIAMTQDPARPRVLLLNWRVDYGTTWAAVAAGQKDARIDTWAAYVKANYGTRKFFLALHHEPENDVIATAGSGMTAADYAAMYRHVVLRLRADGVTNVVNVLAYMGNEKWLAQPWWADLYPGDDVVDWIGLDSYVSVEKGYYHYGDFGDLLDRQPTGGGLGFYDWAARTHPGKPFMVAEWGMYHRAAFPTDKAPAFASVLPELVAHPAIKAICYFDTPSDNEGDRNIAVNSLPSSLAAIRLVAADPVFNVALGR
jgi:hypothetical protein